MPVFGPGGPKNDVRFMSGEKERSEALSIPEASEGARKRARRTCSAPRRAAQAGWTEGAERSLEFAWERMSNTKVSRRLLRMAFQGRALRGRKCRAVFSVQSSWTCTNNSRQRRPVQWDLPPRAPQRGSGKSEPISEEMNYILDSLRQPPPRLRPKTASGSSAVSLPCGADLSWIYRASPPPSTLSPW